MTLSQARLQWGRDQLIAEMNDAADLQCDEPEELQWGRDQLIAEIETLTATSPNTIVLQWGRDQLIAEMCSKPKPIYAPNGGFNGAAIS